MIDLVFEFFGHVVHTLFNGGQFIVILFGVALHIFGSFFHSLLLRNLTALLLCHLSLDGGGILLKRSIQKADIGRYRIETGSRRFSQEFPIKMIQSSTSTLGGSGSDLSHQFVNQSIGIVTGYLLNY